MKTLASVRAAWGLFAGAPGAVRLQAAIRALTCPFPAVIARLPRSGTLLDVGCGHGLLIRLAARDPGRRDLALWGIDHDAAKIAQARRGAPAAARFSTAPLAAFAGADFAAVAVVDVLYTVRLAAWPEILGGCFAALAPGGRLVLKEVVDRPRWKYWAILAQESLSVRVFGITRGEAPHFEPPAVYRGALAAAGFELLEERPLPGAHWVSHYLFVARRPGPAVTPGRDRRSASAAPRADRDPRAPQGR